MLGIILPVLEIEIRITGNPAFGSHGIDEISIRLLTEYKSKAGCHRLEIHAQHFCAVSISINSSARILRILNIHTFQGSQQSSGKFYDAAQLRRLTLVALLLAGAVCGIIAGSRR